MKFLLKSLFCFVFIVTFFKCHARDALCPSPPYDDDIHLTCEVEIGEFANHQTVEENWIKNKPLRLW
jgi:hypothetical protein